MTLDRAPRRTVPVASPPRVAELLRRSPDGPLEVLHACADTIHLGLGTHAVAVTATGAPGLPHALRTDLADLEEIWSAGSSRGSSGGVPTAYLDRGVLHLGGRALVTRRLVDVRAPRLDAAWTPKTSPVAALGTPRPRGAGLVAADGGLGPLDHVDADIVGDLVGRGDGLTPFGDDVLCGWLAVHRAAGIPTPVMDAAIRRALPRTTTVSATLLECALAGEVADLAGDYLRSLGTPGDASARVALTALGHSSGAGLALGIDLGVGDLADRVAA